MEKAELKGNSPFHRDRGPSVFRRGVYFKRGVDAVVVGQGNDRVETGVVDLFLFDPINIVCRQWGGPEGGRKIDALALSFLVSVPFFTPELCYDRKFFSVVRKEIQHLL